MRYPLNQEVLLLCTCRPLRHRFLYSRSLWSFVAVLLVVLRVSKKAVSFDEDLKIIPSAFRLKPTAIPHCWNCVTLETRLYGTTATSIFRLESPMRILDQSLAFRKSTNILRYSIASTIAPSQHTRKSSKSSEQADIV
ncbi:hypothetical protein EJ02DRAFT_109190 [Clathrospora elynae]|uniref:Uncharacterized protein n=1 Tax=Clathrospora elynae TaxID=706981 RepID=A0A6A5SUD8_9PLEO|nr:hypothetical protein EJ02DRAFT_109190 [Clathrospora elynae]